MDDKIYINSDGGYRMTKNIGGWAFTMDWNGHHKESFGTVPNATSQICELYAAMFALEAVKDKSKDCKLTSDSQYVIMGLSTWSKDWKVRSWRGSKGKPIENKEIWKRLVDVADQFKSLEFEHVNGHIGHVGNERCDTLVNFAMDEWLSMNPYVKASIPELFNKSDL